MTYLCSKMVRRYTWIKVKLKDEEVILIPHSHQKLSSLKSGVSS